MLLQVILHFVNAVHTRMYSMFMGTNRRLAKGPSAPGRNTAQCIICLGVAAPCIFFRGHLTKSLVKDKPLVRLIEIVLAVS